MDVLPNGSEHNPIHPPPCVSMVDISTNSKEPDHLENKECGICVDNREGGTSQCHHHRQISQTENLSLLRLILLGRLLLFKRFFAIGRFLGLDKFLNFFRLLNVVRYLGILFALAAALLFSLSALLIKILDYHPFKLAVWRFCFMIFITLPFLFQKQCCDGRHGSNSSKQPVHPVQSLWSLDKATAGFLLLQAFLGCNSILLVFCSLRFLNIGDSVVIGTSAPVFVIIVAWFILHEPCGIVPVATALFAFCGLVVLCKPPILTGSMEPSVDTLIGASFSLGSMFLLTFSYVTIRYLRQVHHSLLQFSFAVFGLMESVPTAYFMGVLTTPECLYEVGLIATNALLAFLAQTCITLALKYENTSLVSMVRTVEVIFCYVWQMKYLHVQPDIFSVIGAVITLSCVVVAAFRGIILFLPDNHKCRKTFRYLLL